MNSHYKGFDVAGAAYNDTQCRSEWFAKRARANHERRRAVVCVREVSHHHKSIVSINTVLTNTVRRRPTRTARIRSQRPDLARAPKSVYKDKNQWVSPEGLSLIHI